MSPVTVVWTATGAVCLTLGLVYLVIWVQQRTSKAHLFFALAALGAGGNAFCDLATMKATTIEQWVFWAKAAHIPLFVLLASLAWFVVAYFGTARRWLAWMVTIAWGLYALGCLVSPYTLIYSDITALKTVLLPWGEIYNVVVGTTHPLKFTADLADLVLLAFFAEATWSLWRRGERGRAVAVGGSLILFLATAGLVAPLADIGVLTVPPLVSLFFLFVILAMAAELTRDVAQTARLSAEVRASGRRWRTLAENVQLLVVGLDRERRITYVNPYVARLTGFSPDELVGRSISEVSPFGVGDGYVAAVEGWLSGESPPFSEARLRTRQGEERTVLLTGVVKRNAEGKVDGLLSVGTDVTDQRRAEKARDEALEDTRRALAEVEELKSRLEEEVVQLRGELRTVSGFDEIVGRSDALLYVLRRLEQVAPLDTTVLIQGETGVGKELIARAIHSRSQRAGRPLVKMDCAALPPNLIEDELFGHEKGAFTGADRMRRGRFELADGGTLFLDEVGDLPLELQGKLLRVIQDGELERVGGDNTLRVDVRLIAATNRNLRDEVQKGRFREDLFYRLNVFPLTIPPLRQRREDIPLLVEAFVKRFAAAHGKEIHSIPQPVVDELLAHEWPGNVRELANAIEQAMVTASGGVLRLGARLTGERANPTAANGDRRTLAQVERQHIAQVLEDCAWRIEGEGGAADRLGLHPNTLRHRLHKLGLKRPTAVSGPETP